MELKDIKSRKKLVNYFAEHGFRNGAEIGVSTGLFSCYMLRTIPELNLLSIDSWPDDAGYRRDTKKDKETAIRRLSEYPKCNVIEQTSMMAACDVPEGSLDFVYIDGDHSFDAVICDLVEWTKRVKPGGIVSGHDYIRRYPGLKKAVDTYVEFHKYALHLTEPQRKGADKYISYFFVKK